MEKCFDIEVRIGEKILEYSGQMIGCWYYGDGILTVTDDKIEGCIALDYCVGTIKGDYIAIVIYVEDEEIIALIPKNIQSQKYYFSIGEDAVMIIVNKERTISQADEQKIQEAKDYLEYYQR